MDENCLEGQAPWGSVAVKTMSRDSDESAADPVALYNTEEKNSSSRRGLSDAFQLVAAAASG